MFILIDGDIRNAADFQQRDEKIFRPPDGLHVRIFLPAAVFRQATCLYGLIRSKGQELHRSATRRLGERYVPIAAEDAIGLPCAGQREVMIGANLG